MRSPRALTAFFSRVFFFRAPAVVAPCLEIFGVDEKPKDKDGKQVN
jgi:hypothetical protein